MLTGKELILATRPYAKELRSKSWYLTLSTLFLMLVLWIGTFFPAIYWINVPSSILLGFVIVRMFVIYHDHQHHAILHRSRTADVIMKIFGIMILAPTSIWKRSHDYHHKHNSKLFSTSIGSYPIVTREKYLKMTAGEKRFYLFTRHPLTIVFGYFTIFIFGMCINSFTSSFRKHADSLIALIIHVTITVLVIVYFGWITWLLSIFVPYFISCFIGAYLFYAQHNFPGVRFTSNVDWKYEVAALESSSYMKLSPFFQWVTANIGYHHIHHLNSRIPFYRLPEVMNAFPELQHAVTTSLKPRDIVACLKLKVWDPDRGEMVGFDKMH